MTEKVKASAPMSIEEQLAEGELNSYQAANLLTVVAGMLKQLKQTESALRAYLSSQLDVDEKLTTTVGMVTLKRGSSAQWKVKNDTAYAM